MGKNFSWLKATTQFSKNYFLKALFSGNSFGIVADLSAVIVTSTSTPDFSNSFSVPIATGAIGGMIFSTVPTQRHRRFFVFETFRFRAHLKRLFSSDSNEVGF